MAQKRIFIPARFLKKDRKTKGTVAIRNLRTGQLQGRATVKGTGDRTAPQRVVHDVDVDKDGRVDFYGGTILGRTKRPRVKKGGRVVVRASSRAKGYERRL